MSMKRLLLLTLTLSSLYPPLAGRAQDKWDLRRCVDYAVANNISVKQADVQARLSQLTYLQNKWNQVPNLSLSSDLGLRSGNNQNPVTYALITQTYTTNNWQLQSSVTAFNFFAIRKAIEFARLSWQAQLANTEKTRNDISLNVANAYLQVLLSIGQTQTAELQLHLSQNQLEITRKQVRAGSLPELNAAELEAQVAQDSATYIGSKGNVQLNILQLKAYMGLDAATPFDVYTPPVEDIPVDNIADLQPDGVYSLALVNQPLQKFDALTIAAQQQVVGSNKASLYPTISFVGSLGAAWTNTVQEPDFSKPPTISTDTLYTLKVAGTNTNIVQTNVTVAAKGKAYFPQLRQTFSQYVGIHLSVPILNNRQARTAYDKSKLQLRNVELQRDQDNLTLKQNIYQAYTAAITALQKFEANKISVTATQKSFEFAQKRYNVGMLNTIDLLTNQNNFFNARINLLNSQFDYVFKMKVLEFYKGLGIKLTKQ